MEPTPGISDCVHHIYRADQTSRIGPSQDEYESDRIAWVPLSDIPALISQGEVACGTTPWPPCSTP